MLIPVRVHGGALSGWRPEEISGTAEVERVLSAVAERSLTDGARAGLDALFNETLRLSGVAGLALHEGRARIAEAGLRLPPLSRLRATQLIPAGDGRTTLVVLPERVAIEQREVLVRIARLAGTLLAARRREVALQERQAALCREVQRQRRELAYREGNRSRASHDLRTPVLVIQGYLDMMNKGLTGELTPAMMRYVERMQSATQDMALLISRQLARGGAPEDLRSLLLEAIEPLTRSRKLTLNLDSNLVEQLVRLLARDLATTRARMVNLRIDAQEHLGMWRLCVSTDRPRLLQSRQMDRLDQLLHRLGGTLSIQDEPPFELRIHLPAASSAPTAR
jgi:signal transduction histidine kinase